ncbi:MAG: hypothetical protein H6739_27045 [Alphaproteobacteria bacterium]|nr:hypothetical protein [Alphaproteobacteria bacterium]
MAQWRSGFSAWLAPVTVDAFRARWWDREPLLLQGRDPQLYDGLLDLDEVDRLLTGRGLCFPTFRLLKDGRVVPPESWTVPELPWGTGAVTGFGKPDAVVQHLQSGCTAVLEQVQRVVPTVARLCRAFEEALRCTTQANAYLTPPGSRGLTPHYDVQNVVVLQLHGAKRWRVHEARVERPLPSQPCAPGGCEPGALLFEATLQPGDLLSLPRGFVHVADTQDQLSLHLSLSALPVTWMDVMQELVARCASDPRFREAVDIDISGPNDAEGPLADAFEARLDAMAELADLDDTLDALARRFVDTRLPLLGGMVEALDAPVSVTRDSRLRRRTGLIHRIEVEGDFVTLRFHGRFVRLPWHALETARFVADGAAFCVRDVPGQLGDAERLALCRHLAQTGFLEPA